jgi:hypothetical protein
MDAILGVQSRLPGDRMAPERPGRRIIVQISLSFKQLAHGLHGALRSLRVRSSSE